ncbi:MAG: abortive infection system antitoxin AbiGi family protein [Bryobacteraceae bacterium]
MAGQNYVSTELTHFVGRGFKTTEEQFRLLLEILRTGWLRPSYRGEFGAGTSMRTDSQKPLTSNECVRAAALCFCDIPFDHLAVHMAKYSAFGLAFSKRFLLARGASPVFYVAKNAAAPSSPGIGPCRDPCA